MIAALVLAALVPQGGSAPPTPDVPETLGRAPALAAMGRALDWLVANQREDGAWGSAALDDLFDAGFSIETYYCYHLAANAIACLALLEGPETPERRAALERGVGWLCDTRTPKRGSDWDSDYVWAGLYGTVAVVAAAGDERFAGPDWAGRLEEAGGRYLDILLRNQVPEGGWAYYDDPIYSRRPKWATSFCTALVLPSLQAAGELGWLTDPAVLARAKRYVERCALPNGAYEYDLRPVPRISGGEHINRVKGSLGRIQVCNWGLASVGSPRITTERLREGLDAFFEHHRFLDVARMRPIPHEAYYANAGYFYFFGHYYAAQAINLLPPEQREAYHARLRPHLIKVQRADGSSSDFLASSSQITSGTAYLALSLALGLAPEGP